MPETIQIITGNCKTFLQLISCVQCGSANRVLNHQAPHHRKAALPLDPEVFAMLAEGGCRFVESPMLTDGEQCVVVRRVDISHPLEPPVGFLHVRRVVCDGRSGPRGVAGLDPVGGNRSGRGFGRAAVDVQGLDRGE